MLLTLRQQEIVDAVTSNNPQEIKSVFENNTDDIDNLIETPDGLTNHIISATIMGWNNSLKELLRLGANPNIQDHNGSSALIIAAERNNIKAMELLLNDPRTDPNIQNLQGNTALAFSVIFAHSGDKVSLNITNKLLTSGANIEPIISHPKIETNVKEFLQDFLNIVD